MISIVPYLSVFSVQIHGLAAGFGLKIRQCTECVNIIGIALLATCILHSLCPCLVLALRFLSHAALRQ